MNDLIQSLIQTKVLRSKSVIKAFHKIDRKDFVLDIYADLAYNDTPLAIDHGQTISQPTTVALMLEWLDVQEGQTVLDIGAGSGWQTVLLAELVGASGHVHACERIPELCEFARQNLARYPQYKERISLHCESAVNGWPKSAPYNRIIAAASSNEIPDEWLQQLSPDGILVAPTDESIFVVKRNSDLSFTKHEHHGFIFVPFIT